MTFADVIKANKGHTTGFDYLRIGLAIAVVVDHCALLSAGKLDLFQTPYHAVVTAIMPAFFALSGYLVTSSSVRNSIPQFIALRVLRIFPALVFEVVLSAFVLGGIFTVLPLKQYFGDPEFHRYLLNMFGIIHFSLPGVFQGGMINLQLWTIPIELECYILMVVVGVFGLVRRRYVLLVISGLLCITMTIISFRYALIGRESYSGRILVCSFLFGSIVYLFRDRVRYNAVLFAISLVLSAITLSYPALGYLSAPPVAYAVGYIGLQRFKPIPFGDLSYGLYLFHFPVSQTINHLNGSPLSWPALFVATMIVTTMIAAFSWYLIEKPLLQRKPSVLAYIARHTPRALRDLSALNPREAPEVSRSGALPRHVPDGGMTADRAAIDQR